MGRLVLAACALFAFAVGAKADEATDLLYFSGELISGRNYAGVGWLHAVSGLDSSGFVLSAGGGEPQWRQVFAAGQAGWRFAGAGFSATFMGGLEADPRLHPLASADLWLEPTPPLDGARPVRGGDLLVVMARGDRLAAGRELAMDRPGGRRLRGMAARRFARDGASVAGRVGGPGVGGRLVARGAARRSLLRGLGLETLLSAGPAAGLFATGSTRIDRHGSRL